MKVLIVGAGIAGPAFAYWLNHHGLVPTILEQAPRLRTGGYIVDFWGAGFDIADRMGLLPAIIRKGYRIQEVRVVDRSGQRVAGFSADVFIKATHGRFVSLRRGDLAATIFEKIEGKVETIFGDSVARIDQSEKAVHVTFESGTARDFDLVVGADGLHSRVRELVFGPQSQFEDYLGCNVAAFEAEGYQPRDESVYVMYTEVGQQVVRFAMRDNRTLFLFTFAGPAINAAAMNVAAQKELLRKRFGKSGWECDAILKALDRNDDLYVDRVSQIRMDPQLGLWTRGRVSLIGDAASCVSLLAGEGSGLAIAAAYILAGELHRARGDYALAFAQYQELFSQFVLQKQKAALRYAGTFTPKSKFALFLRDRIMNLMTIPYIAHFAVGRDLVDKLTLPEY